MFVVHRQDEAGFVPVVHQVKGALGQQAQLQIDHVLPIKTAPKTTSGKIQRYRLAEQYLAGEFDAVIKALQVDEASEGEGSDLEQMLLQIFNEIITDVRVGSEDNFVEAGVSSLSLAEIAEHLDGLYPELLELSDFLECPTIVELANLIQVRAG